MFILLPLNDEGVPETWEKRCEIIEYVYKKAFEYGFGKEDIIVDGLVMTVSSDQNAAIETLKVIKWCKNEFGTGSIVEDFLMYPLDFQKETGLIQHFFLWP